MCDFLSLFCSPCCKSLVTGCFPTEFKQSIVRPLLKKSRLDNSELNTDTAGIQIVTYRVSLSCWSRLSSLHIAISPLDATEMRYTNLHFTYTYLLTLLTYPPTHKQTSYTRRRLNRQIDIQTVIKR